VSSISKKWRLRVRIFVFRVARYRVCAVRELLEWYFVSAAACNFPGHSSKPVRGGIAGAVAFWQQGKSHITITMDLAAVPLPVTWTSLLPLFSPPVQEVTPGLVAAVVSSGEGDWISSQVSNPFAVVRDRFLSVPY